jgi:hypothetical protein
MSKVGGKGKEVAGLAKGTAGRAPLDDHSNTESVSVYCGELQKLKLMPDQYLLRFYNLYSAPFGFYRVLRTDEMRRYYQI